MKGASLADVRAAGRRAQGEHGGLTRDELLAAYRLMLLSRKIDDKEIQLKNQSQAFFQISGAGHEAVLGRSRTASPWRLRLVLSVLPRSRALSDAWIHAVRNVPRVGRRQGRSGIRRPADALALGAQAAQHSVAEQRHRHSVPSCRGLRRSDGDLPARRRDRGSPFQVPRRRDYLRVHRGRRDERGRVLGIAEHRRAPERLPILYLCEDNGYAISVPVEAQTPGGDISRIVEHFPALRTFRCDGTDYPGSYRTLAEAVAHVRSRKGPAFVHATVIRPVLALTLGRREAVQDHRRA